MYLRQRSNECFARLPCVLSLALAAAWIFSGSAHAAEANKPPASIWEQDTLSGDWGGARKTLKDKYGIDVTLNSIDETLARSLRRAAPAAEL